MRGLTGGIATGKSAVAKILRELGAVVLDADQISRAVVAPGELGWEQVRKKFPEVINQDGQINRVKLGEIIFNDTKARKNLNSIVHPLVIGEIKSKGKVYEAEQKIVFADIPLLYETNSQSWLEEVWLVYVPQKIQVERLMQRNNINREEALKRIAAQISIESKYKLADQIIDNSLSLAETKSQVVGLWHRLINQE